MTFSRSFDRQIRFLGLGLLFGIYLVWQLPNVIALRYFLLLGLAILFVPTGLRGCYATLTIPATGPSSRPVFIAYFLFIAWLFVVAVAIAAVPGRSLEGISGQWLPSTLCLLIGYGAALTPSARQTTAVSPVRVAYWALLAHAILQLVVAMWTIHRDGSLHFENFGGISDHKANVTYTNALAVALLLADMVFSSEGARLLGIGRTAQATMFGILLLSTYVSSTRNGIIVFLMLTALGTLAFWFATKRRASRIRWGVLAVCIAVTITGALLALRSDARWGRFMATVPVAWDIDANHAWVNVQKYPAPLAADGGPVDLSAYERIAYLHAALRFLAQNPLGTEVSRDAFKRQVSMNYSYAHSGHPHNSYLELGISVGLPGLVCWLMFLGTMIWLGLQSFRSWHSLAGVALLLVVFGFVLRSLLDSIVRDHIIQEFMLTCGLLIGSIEVSRAHKALIAPR